ncbi:MAG TPA: MaoC/PaaZ C-terminal domain-containing protein [bacterium]|nr:MaoC/PaaZ C-terminal domain-containing protein [bacterium]
MAGIKTDCVGKKLTPAAFSWIWKDIALYNVGIGAYELEHTYENTKGGIRVIPSFAVVPPFPCLASSLGLTGVNPMMVLHGEQKIIIKKRPLPFKAETITAGEITDLWDKGKGAVYRILTKTKTKEGEELFDNIFTVFVRGAGGFGGDKGPEPGNVAPERAPDQTIEDQTMPVQNLIYRLSGDINPLHIDPNFAKMARFEKPILHGLCSFGFVMRAAIKACCAGDDAKVKEYEVRFRDVVYPGQKIITKIWKDGAGRAIISANTDDGRNCIANAAVAYDE